MRLPTAIFTALGKTGYTFYDFLYRSPKIDVALIYQSTDQHPVSVSPFNDEAAQAPSKDTLLRYKITGNYILMLKNNSQNTAYHIKVLNALGIFTSIDRIDPLAHLSPQEKLGLRVSFSYYAELTEKEANKAPGMPIELHNRNLIIAYQNEARTNFYTLFKLSDRDTHNTYHLKLPME